MKITESERVSEMVKTIGHQEPDEFDKIVVGLDKMEEGGLLLSFHEYPSDVKNLTYSDSVTPAIMLAFRAAKEHKSITYATDGTAEYWFIGDEAAVIAALKQLGL